MSLPNEIIEWIFLGSILLLTLFSIIMGGYLTMRIRRMGGFNLKISYRPPDSEAETKKKKKQKLII
ncbi:Spiroplasma plectrovirus-related protein [Caenorhabditis elegans]|uniref:Spiroplasma plectrovirus-related protein n=1 Tax=Caenorhabditis elegans TaxID=6239 RepID=C8JQN9_CAEEL|nr:Spiroplasma plectrovirus-related protein [Caenorhabditis elegans]CCD66016.1 Spiroplasma plectrovirus-related protein [Caenorhabditis elegans]|eukprot:NP_001254953.1 Uncharacterized protein CELE_C29E4.17 [Caenorhabditis elegans]